MKILKGIWKGLGAYSRALSFIIHQKLTWFFIFPLLLNILLYIFGYSLLKESVDSLGEHLETSISVFSNDYFNNELVLIILSFFLNVIFKLSFFIAFIFFSGYLIVVIMSPIFSLISERTEKILSGKTYTFDTIQLLKDVTRGLYLAIRNAFIQIIFFIFLFLLSFIPLMGFVTPFLIFIGSSYFYGFSFMDYAIERRRLNIKESVKYMRDNKGLVIGNGLIYALLLLIPVIGVFLSAFVAIISVVAGTILVHEEGLHK